MKKSLHAGKVPEVYKDIISDMEVKEVRRKVKDEPVETEKAESIYGTAEEMQKRAKERNAKTGSRQLKATMKK